MKDYKTKYATLFYGVRQRLDITWSEYVFLEMVYHLSHKSGVFFKSQGSIAYDLGITQQGVSKMINRLIQKGLINKDEEGISITTAYHREQALQPTTKLSNHNLVTKPTTKLTNPQLSSTKNYIKNNKESDLAEKPVALNNPSYLKAKAVRDKLRGNKKALK